MMLHDKACLAEKSTWLPCSCDYILNLHNSINESQNKALLSRLMLSDEGRPAIEENINRLLRICMDLARCYGIGKECKYENQCKTQPVQGLCQVCLSQYILRFQFLTFRPKVGPQYRQLIYTISELILDEYVRLYNQTDIFEAFKYKLTKEVVDRALS